MTWTCAELIAFLSEHPPETPVVSHSTMNAVRPSVEMVHKADDGGYIHFESARHQHRNDAKVVVIR